jgi:hypothetical protein
MRRCVLAAVLAAAFGTAPAAHGATRLVRYEVSQAIPSGNRLLTVRSDGDAVARREHRRHAFTLSERQLRSLKRLVERADFATLQVRYKRPEGPPLVGGPTEHVRAAGKTVTIDPGAATPRRLTRLVRRLRHMFAAHDPGR